LALAVISVPPDPCHDSRVHPQRCSIDIERSWALVMLMDVVFIFLSLFIVIQTCCTCRRHQADEFCRLSGKYLAMLLGMFQKKGIEFPILCVFDFRPEVPHSSVYRFVFGAMHIVLLFSFSKGANQLPRILSAKARMNQLNSYSDSPKL